MTIEKMRDGLAVLAEYDGSLEVVAEHERVWAGHGCDPSTLDGTSLEKLKAAGWKWDRDVEAWRADV